jgi:hypothetical protein
MRREVARSAAKPKIPFLNSEIHFYRVLGLYPSLIYRGVSPWAARASPPGPLFSDVVLNWGTFVFWAARGFHRPGRFELGDVCLLGGSGLSPPGPLFSDVVVNEMWHAPEAATELGDVCLLGGSGLSPPGPLFSDVVVNEMWHAPEAATREYCENCRQHPRTAFGWRDSGYAHVRGTEMCRR